MGQTHSFGEPNNALILAASERQSSPRAGRGAFTGTGSLIVERLSSAVHAMATPCFAAEPLVDGRENFNTAAGISEAHGCSCICIILISRWSGMKQARCSAARQKQRALRQVLTLLIFKRPNLVVLENAIRNPAGTHCKPGKVRARPTRSATLAASLLIHLGDVEIRP